MISNIRFSGMIAIWILLGLCSAGFAQQSSDVPETQDPMEEILVVAPPIIEGNEVDRYAGEKTVVSEDQIKDMNAQNIASALRMSPGVNITRYNTVGSFGGATGGAVFIRGMGSSRPGAEIKMLMDGVPMYMSVWNHPLLDMMSIDPAQSVEVYKSPQPNVFGNAFSVINIIPRKKDSDGYVSKLDVSGGSFNTFTAKAENGGKQGDVDYYMGGGLQTSQGHRENADGALNDFYGWLGYHLSDHWSTSLFTFACDNYADDPGKEGAALSTRLGRYETKAWLTSFKLENRFSAADGYLQVYNNTGKGNFLNQPTSKTGVLENQYNDFTFYGVKAKESFKLWNGGEIVSGADWDTTRGRYDDNLTSGVQNNWDGHEFRILSPYMAISQLIGRKDGFYITPSAGARYYDDSDFESEWAPHAGMIVGYRSTELHTGYSRGVIYPGLDVVVLSEKVTPALRQSWRNLKAEKVDHFEVGARHRFSSLAVIDVTWFHDDGKDRYVVIPAPPYPPTFANIENYRIQGVESTLTLYPTDTLSVFTGVTHLDTNPSDLPYAPKTTASAGMNLRFLEAFGLNLDCQYVDIMYVDSQARRSNAVNSISIDSYFLVNGKLSYRFWAGDSGHNAEVYLSGENLTNTSYEYYPGYPMPGISAMLGMDFTL
jgi:iron complex outermembrane receptor protein